MQIFKLFGSVLVDNDKANKSLSATDKKAESLGHKFVKGAGTAAKFGAALGTAAIAGGAAVVGLAKKVGDTADTILDLSSQTGMSTDSIQKWRQVATVAGVDADSMADVSKKLTKQMDIMSTGSGKAAEALETLGIDFEDLSEMTADERLDAITEALGGVEDQTDRAKLGTDLLGGSWDKLAPILDVGADKLKDIKDNANVISNEDLNQANEFRIKMDQMKERAILFGQQLLVKVIPTLNKLFDWVMDNMPAIEDFFGQAFEFIGSVVTQAVDIFQTYLMPVLESMIQWVKDHMPEIKQFFNDTFEAIKVAVQVAGDIFVNYLMPTIRVLWELIKTALPIIKVIFEEVFKIIVMVVKAAWEIFEKVFLPILKTIFQWVQNNMPTIKAVFKAVFAVIGTAIQVVIDIFTVYFTILGKVYDFVAGTFQGMGKLIRSAFDGVTDFLQGIADKFNAVKDGVSGAINKVKDFFKVNKGEDETSSGSVGSTTDVPGLFNGGETLTDGIIKVGERGPETLMVPRGSRVKPLDEAAGSGAVPVHITVEGGFINEQGVEDFMDLMVDVLNGRGVQVV